MSRSSRNPQCNPPRDKIASSNCRTNCPGIRNPCLVGQTCPAQVPRVSCTEQEPCMTTCTQTQPSIFKVSSCGPSSGCSAPIVIQAPSDQNGAKTDLRIELYIHQLTPGQDDSQNVDGGPRLSNANRSAGKVGAPSGRRGSLRKDDDGTGGVPESDQSDSRGYRRGDSPNEMENESGSPTSSPYANGPGSDVGPNKFGKVDVSTDTEEDQNTTRRSISGGRMVDIGTQVAGIQ